MCMKHERTAEYSNGPILLLIVNNYVRQCREQYVTLYIFNDLLHDERIVICSHQYHAGEHHSMTEVAVVVVPRVLVTG